MDFVSLTIDVLKVLSKFAMGNWGLAIILLTIIVRLLLWPLSYSQQRSMRTMQTLQPKLKAIQDRYKSDPQTMQRKMMEFYKEHKFNPMAGCFPLLLQLPVFILLYSALMSPQFIQIAGDSKFFFLDRLDATIRGTAGRSFDGSFGVSKYDTFMAGKTATVYVGNEKLENVKIEKPQKAVIVMGEIIPGQTLDLKIDINNVDLRFDEQVKITKAEIPITDVQTKEIENVTFERRGDILAAQVPTVQIVNSVHYDVIFLVLLFCLTMWLAQKVMMAQTKNQPQDPTQQAIQKSMGTLMPVMIGATFIFIPIPAGVLLYLIASNIIQILQTVIINKQLEAEDEKKKMASHADSAKKIDAKDIK